MARARKVTSPVTRGNGVVTGGNVSSPSGQPNGRIPKGLPIAAAAGTGGPVPYGQGQQLQNDVQQTTLPPGVTPMGDNVRQQFANHYRASKITPLFAPTERPFEHVTAGAPLAPGPTASMAQPTDPLAGSSIADIISQAAQASGSPVLQALADRAQTTSGSAAPPMMPGALPGQ